ncbi:hypothetical protein H2200_010311 [Cladophialophora chaetospira]|uniref:Uncharacterized protein n=1 Tax=Cladophialophora chaetospira TaxID=386627 RepID=A0AA38X1D7_9EURO|nr:hypothetical protein H2200_010311 [Cladophialophora chaetospira]
MYLLRKHMSSLSQVFVSIILEHNLISSSGQTATFLSERVLNLTTPDNMSYYVQDTSSGAFLFHLSLKILGGYVLALVGLIALIAILMIIDRHMDGPAEEIYEEVYAPGWFHGGSRNLSISNQPIDSSLSLQQEKHAGPLIFVKLIRDRAELAWLVYGFALAGVSHLWGFRWRTEGFAAKWERRRDFRSPRGDEISERCNGQRREKQGLPSVEETRECMSGPHLRKSYVGPVTSQQLLHRLPIL